MKKLLLVTLQGNYNYGNRLQNCALQSVLEKNGYSVDNLLLQAGVLGWEGMKDKYWKWKLWTIIGRKGFDVRFAKLAKELGCIRFSEKYTPRMFLPYDRLDSFDWSQYSFAIAGSDQVWHNWHKPYADDELYYYYLRFITPDKRISYAPSFGFSHFPEEDLESHRIGLLGMKALSCREAEGCAMIRELTGREAEKVLDPVLLLSPNEWKRIARRPPFRVRKPYLLKFFLGTVTPEYQTEIERIRAERKLCVLNINDLSEPEHYGLNPAQFVWLISHADTVCTDSFHASAFSVLFQRRLRVFARVQERHDDMFGRLRDLLQPLGLMRLTYSGQVEADLRTDLEPTAAAWLEQERSHSIQYLLNSLTE